MVNGWGSEYRNTGFRGGGRSQVELCWTFYNGPKNWVEKHIAAGSDPYRFYCQLPFALQTSWSRDFSIKVLVL